MFSSGTFASAKRYFTALLSCIVLIGKTSLRLRFDLESILRAITGRDQIIVIIQFNFLVLWRVSFEGPAVWRGRVVVVGRSALGVDQRHVCAILSRAAEMSARLNVPSLCRP
jgi:hypothetical protein